MKIPYRVPAQFGATRMGQTVKVRINNRVREGVFIGAGRFSNVFWVGNDVFAFTWYGDMSKEILTCCEQVDHIPKVELVDSHFGPHDWLMRVYKMPHYRKVRGPKWDHIFAALEAASNSAIMKFDGKLFTRKVCRKINDRLIDIAGDLLYDVAPDLLYAVEEIAYQATKYDSYLFDDFAKRNWGLDQNGKLVLLDALYSAQIVRDDIIARKTKG